jgi:hypothetical protein
MTPPQKMGKKQITWLVLRALTDFAIIFGTLLWLTGMPLGFPFAATVAVLLIWEKRRLFWPARVLYIGFCFMFVDTVILGMWPLWCVSKWMTVVSIVLVPVSHWTLLWKMPYSVRRVTYSFLPALLAMGITLGIANAPSDAEECAVVSGDPRLETLVDLNSLPEKRGLPRYLVRRENMGDLVVTYRGNYNIHGIRSFADHVDLKTGKITAIPGVVTEAIGAYYDPPRRQLILIGVDHDDREHPKTITVLDQDFNLVTRRDFPGSGDDYAAYMMEHEGLIAIQADGLYWLDPETLEVAKDSGGCLNAPLRKECRLMCETGFIEMGPDKFFLSGGGNPLITQLSGGNGLCSCNLKTREVETWKVPLGGAWDSVFVPEKNEVLATSFWRDKIWVIPMAGDAPARTLELGPCLRPVAWDSKLDVGYTAECFSGYMLTFNETTGEILDRRFIGRNSRKIYVFEDLGTIIILSGCGVYRLRPAPP